MRVSFLVPAYNEGATIGELLERVEALELDKQVIVVDDGSTDDTPTILERWESEGEGRLVIRQPNRGKGAAIRAAIARMDGEIAVIQDADLEYDPVDVPGLIEPIEGGVTNVLYNTTLHDMETGYKAFRADVLRSLDLRSDDFAIEPEITAKVCLRGLRIYELPIAYYGRTYAEGKKITWRDGFKALYVLVSVRLGRD